MNENTTQDIQDTVSPNDAVTDDKVDNNNLINDSEKEETFNKDSTDYFTLVPESLGNISETLQSDSTQEQLLTEIKLIREDMTLLTSASLVNMTSIGLCVGVVAACIFSRYMHS